MTWRFIATTSRMVAAAVQNALRTLKAMVGSLHQDAMTTVNSLCASPE
jgi:hypothetical protein